MKKTIFFLIIAFILSISAPFNVKAAATGDFCDPKKMGECESKIDSLLTSIDALRSKLLKAREEIKGGKKLTNEQADRMLKRMDEMQKAIPPVVTNPTGNLYDY